MPSQNEIKNRIRSISDTRKITNAMYLIASTKVRKAKAELDRTRPYFDSVQREIKRIFRIQSDVESHYFYPPDGSHISDGTYGCLVITADKGLAGAYNQNVIKQMVAMLEEHPDTKLFVVGEYGRQYCLRHHIPMVESFLYTAQNPTMRRAREITSRVLDLYDREEIDKLFVLYTDWKNGQEASVVSTRLLPFHRKDFVPALNEKPVVHAFEFVPSMEAVLNSMMQSYVAGFVYSALVDSFCSEQNARMMAMDAANKNAENMLEQLSVSYNRVRQTAITQEITEVSSGAKAQKQSKEVFPR